MCTLNVEELIWKVNKWDGAPCNIKITDISMWKNDCRLYVCALSQTTYVFNFAFNVQSTRSRVHTTTRERAHTWAILNLSRELLFCESFLLHCLWAWASAHIDTHGNYLAKIRINLRMLDEDVLSVHKNWVKLRSEMVDAIRKKKEKAKLMISLFT